MSDTSSTVVPAGVGASGHMLELRAAPARHVEPEPFQAGIIAGMGARLRDSELPVLLRAPTGAGKTLMLARALQETAAATRTLWFWFTPYAHLVAQTMDAVEATCPGLRTYSLADERHADHAPGDVLVANVQVVAASRTQLRRINKDDDETVSLATLIDRARGRGYRIGIVVDEAHLGLSSETVFGGLVRQIAPDRLLMATATPRDGKLASFVDAAGYAQYVTFAASRIDAVNAGLNKRYVLAHVYKPTASVATLADIRGTVLLRAWGRHQRVKNALREAGVATTPLMLVQVENGAGTVEAAFQALVHTCGVRADLIAQHSVDTPDPLVLAGIANDTSREVLIFKESAGTGFDAPRAFVLASMKHVSDEGFATQFLGRIMRVDRGVRALLKALERGDQRLPVELDVGYLYLAHPQVQAGFQQAVTTMQGIHSELDGALEGIRAVTHRNGSTTFTNVPASQEALVLREPPAPGAPVDEEDADEAEALARAEQAAARERAEAVAVVRATLVPQDAAPYGGGGSHTRAGALPPADDGGEMFGGVTEAPAAVHVTGSLFDGFPGMEPLPAPASRPGRRNPGVPAEPPVLADEAAVAGLWRRAGVQVYPLRADLTELGRALRTEVLPALQDLRGVAQTVGERVVIGDGEVAQAFRMAVHGIEYRETATELTALSAGAPGAPEPAAAGLEVGGSRVRGVVNRDRLAREARAVLQDLGLDEGDRAVLLETLAGRISADLDDLLSLGGDYQAAERTRLERDVVHHLVRGKGPQLERAYSQALSEFVRVEDAAPLPRAVLFPLSRALAPSPRNIYGVRPPTAAEREAAEQDPQITTLLRQTSKHKHDLADGGEFVAAYLDGAWQLNGFERAVAEALDEAEWVKWWHRNPPLKPYSVAVVKATERGRFYPDFVVCVQPFPGSRVRQRLLEPKESADDARQRMARDPREYGRVFFLKMSGKRIYIRNRDGTLGPEAGEEMEGLRKLLQAGE